MKVKILVHNGMKEPFFVDSRKLDGGIYSTNLPSIYSLDETIQKLDDVSLKYFGENSVNFRNNLKQCELKIYELKEVEQ